MARNQWHHAAFVRSSAKTTLYVNGTKAGNTYSDSGDYDSEVCRIGSNKDGGQEFD